MRRVGQLIVTAQLPLRGEAVALLGDRQAVAERLVVDSQTGGCALDRARALPRFSHRPGAVGEFQIDGPDGLLGELARER